MNKMLRCAALLLSSLLFISALRAEPDSIPAKPSQDQLAAMAASLKWQTGSISLKDGLAKISLTDKFRFLGHDDANKVLHDIWGNPSDPRVLGMIFPADAGPLDPGNWAIAISYEEGGYVKDNDAGKINYTDLLKQMQQEVHAQNAAREREGYPSVELVGWATPPHYDRATHKLYWAKDIRFANEPGDTLNYNIRVLGRRGVLVLNAIAGMPQFPEIDRQMPQVLTMVDFQAGNTYADFDPKVDKIATYGLATLIAGGALGAAAKLGAFKFLFPVLLALKKFGVVAVVAIIAFFKKFAGRFSGKHSTPDHLLPPRPPQ
jgi:uncharacterized membrane-anchored protein